MNRAKEKSEIMKTQSPSVRITNMNEVELGYSKEEAINESQRCLNCPTKPCVAGCPIEIDIPAFLKETSECNFDKALSIIQQDSLFPALCGRVCPQEKQCQKNCTVGKMHKDVRQSVAIGRVERFLADNVKSTGNIEKSKNNHKKVAIIGSGPAGIACAADLLKLGYEVHIFEAFHKLGGVLVYGIPEFRLPKSIVEKQLLKVKELGAVIHLDTLVGRTVTIEQLMNEDDFKAVFIAAGAGLPNFLKINGENAKGVVSANEYLSRVNLMKAYDKNSRTPVQHSKNVVVFGAGNVAMDASRTALRMGADKVSIVYRRGEDEIPARAEEVQHAKEEGVEFKLLYSPVEILTDENSNVSAVKVSKCRLTEPDESGRRTPVVIENSEEVIPCDLVIVAIGNSSAPLIPLTTPNLNINKRGNIIVDPETLETSIKGVYAGGDIVLGSATVILAMGQGRKAARSIDAYLSK